MKVKVLVFTTLRKKLGWKERVLVFNKDSISLYELLENIPKLESIVVNENSNLRKGFIVLVNGVNCESLKGLKTMLRSGDVVSIFPPAGGG